MIFKVKMLKIIIVLVECLTLSMNLKSQNVSVSDSIVEINPMDIFKNWKDLDTIRLEWINDGCQYSVETLELIKTEDLCKAKISGGNETYISLKAKKSFNKQQLEILKNSLKTIMVKGQGGGCHDSYSLILSINRNTFWQYDARRDCGTANPFKEIEQTIFNIPKTKPRKKKKREY